MLRYGIKGVRAITGAYNHYNKYKPYYDTGYALGQMAIAGTKRKKGDKRPKSRKRSKGASKKDASTQTWGMSSSAYKGKKAAKARSNNRYVDGTTTLNKKISYKPAKFTKQLALQGGKYIKEMQSNNILYHATTDDAYTQKVQLLDFLYDGGVPVAGGTNITSYMNDMYANQLTTAPLYSSGAIVASKAEGMKIYLHSATWNIEFTNMSAGATNMTIYVAMCKNTKSTGTGPTTDWTNGLIAEQGSQITAPNPNRIGNKPTSSKLFNTNYKIVDKQQISAGPGAKIHYNFSFNPRSIIDTTYFVRNNQVRGLTYALFVVTHGQLGLGGPSNNIVVPKPVQWIYNIRKRYVLRTVNSFPTVLNQQVSDSALVSAVNPVTVMEDDGDIES